MDRSKSYIDVNDCEQVITRYQRVDKKIMETELIYNSLYIVLSLFSFAWVAHFNKHFLCVFQIFC